jgi:short-subunit dehydrogenase
VKDKVLITGASSGLGKHLVEKFVSEGHEVFSHNGRRHYNLTRMDDVVRLAQAARAQEIKVLVNNAAIVCPNIVFPNYSITQICDMIDVNLRAPIVLTHCLLGDLNNIININSMVGLEVKSPRTLYSATKWGLRGFANSLKKENNDVKVLDVYPTNIETYPGRANSMNIKMVVDEIYGSYSSGAEKLILDGRKL